MQQGNKFFISMRFNYFLFDRYIERRAEVFGDDQSANLPEV